MLRYREMICAAALAGTLVLAQAARAEPLPGDVAAAAVRGFDRLFGGPYPGHRAVHATGMLAEGIFVPSADAGTLSRADHFRVPVPVLVRFSAFAGVPAVPDQADGASPRGMSIKFILPDGGDTDIVAHSYNGFPASTPDEFVAFLRALATPDPMALKRHLAEHPAAQTFVDTPKPPPASYATERFFGVNAFRFTNEAGVGRFGRYRIEPVAGTAHLTADDAAQRAADYLTTELQERLDREPAEFKLLVQLAASSDDILDGSRPWPDDRTLVDAGTIRLTRFVPDSAAAQRNLLFTPLSLVDGIAPSADPLLVARSRSYRASFDRRRDDAEIGTRSALSGSVR